MKLHIIQYLFFSWYWTNINPISISNGDSNSINIIFKCMITEFGFATLLFIQPFCTATFLRKPGVDNLTFHVYIKKALPKKNKVEASKSGCPDHCSSLASLGVGGGVKHTALKNFFFFKISLYYMLNLYTNVYNEPIHGWMFVMRVENTSKQKTRM